MMTCLINQLHSDQSSLWAGRAALVPAFCEATWFPLSLTNAVLCCCLSDVRVPLQVSKEYGK